MQFASYYAGVSFTRAYVGYVHALAHALGGYYNVPHGLANAILLPRVLESFGPKAYARLSEIADTLALSEGKNKEEKAKAVIAWIDDCVNNSGCELVSDQRNIWAYTNQATEKNDLKYKYVVANNLSWEGNSCKETVFANKHNLKSNWTYTWWSNTVSQFYSPSADNYSNVQSYPFGTGWGAGPVSPAFVK